MATGYESSVLLVTAALSLFCFFGVCTGQLTLDLQRDDNRITLRCLNRSFEVPNAAFYMRAPGSRDRVIVNRNSDSTSVMNFTRTGDRGGVIEFIITPDTEANFTCASSPTSGVETPGLLLAAFRDSSVGNPSQTALPGETVELECDIQPGRAMELYSVQWFRYNPTRETLTASTSSLSVPVEDMSQNGTEYQCSVTITSCLPSARTECRSTRSAEGARITLEVGELINITGETQDHAVTVGENATFTCSARGTNATIFWRIGGMEYQDCSMQGFCVRNTTVEGSVSSTFEINTRNIMIVEDVTCIVEQRSRRLNSTARLTVISSPTTSLPSPSPTPPTPPTTVTEGITPSLIPPAILNIVYVVIGIVALIVLVSLSFCTLICVLRICQNKGKIDISDNKRIPRSVRRMISGSGSYHQHQPHDYEDIEAQWPRTNGPGNEMPPGLFEGTFSRQNGVPNDPTSGLYSELPFFADDNMSEFFQDQIYNLSTKSGESSTYYPTYFPNPFPHVTGSQQNLASSQMSLPLSGSETYARLYPPPSNHVKQSRTRSISQSSDHSDHSQHSNHSRRSSKSQLSNHSQHSNHSRRSSKSQLSNHSHRTNRSQYSNHSHHSNHSHRSNHSRRSNRSAVAEPQIPLAAPFPMNPSDPPPLPSHPPLEQRSSIPDEILLTVVSCLMHRRNCQIPSCPCKSVQERYRELCRQHPSYHPHQHAAETCKRECGPHADPGERKHQLHLTLSSQNLTDDTHPHYHLTTKSHIRHVMPRPPLVRQRSRSCDLTPTREFPSECSPVAPIATADDGSEVDGFYSDPTYEDYKPPYLREISISADNIPALCLNDCPLTPTPLKEYRTLISSPMRSRPRRWSMPKATLKTVKEKQISTESSETDHSNTSSRSGSHEHIATGSDSEVHSERPGQKRTYSPIPPNPNGYKKVTSLGESGYDSTVENTPPNPRWYNKVTSLGESGYDSNNYETESEGHSNPSTGQLPRKAQPKVHLHRQPNALVNSTSMEVTETLC